MTFPSGLSVSATFAAPARGDLIAGRYRIERKIGTGGMGFVVAALDEATGTRVAIKLLLPEGSTAASGFADGDGSEVVERTNRRRDLATRLLREASAASRIASEHVTRVLDIGRLDSGDPYVVMELLEGADLGRHAKERGPMPVAEVVSLVLQACEAIQEAHTLGIVHRDLKPANLFLTRKPDGTPFVKVLDFGISKVLGADDNQLTATSDMLGSPLYMAPEQIRNARDVDARADVWSLGTILYRLLAGRAAFEANGSAATLAAIIGDTPEPLRNLRPDVPPDLEALVRHCLEKDRHRRVQSVRELMIALLRFSVAQTGEYAPAVVPAPLPPAAAANPSTASVAPNAVTVSGPRQRSLAVAVAGLFVAATVLGCLVAWQLFAPGAAAPGDARSSGMTPATSGLAAAGGAASATSAPPPSPSALPSAPGTSAPAASATASTAAEPPPSATPSAPVLAPATSASASAKASASPASRPVVHAKPSEDPLGDRL
jgi:serine/threonine protein kinase